VKVLVTGGAGFIGSHVVDRLKVSGHEARIFDLFPSPYHGSADVETVLGDITDAAALTSAMHGCTAVVHLAAVSDVNHVVANPDYAELVNGHGT
jgi:UDP-glucose 4-epimerase